jgi:hypothetical protein
MRTAYKEVIESLKKQLMNAASKGIAKSTDKQIPVELNFNQLSVSEIISNYISIIIL